MRLRLSNIAFLFLLSGSLCLNAITKEQEKLLDELWDRAKTLQNTLNNIYHGYRANGFKDHKIYDKNRLAMKNHIDFALNMANTIRSAQPYDEGMDQLLIGFVDDLIRYDSNNLPIDGNKVRRNLLPIFDSIEMGKYNLN